MKAFGIDIDVKIDASEYQAAQRLRATHRTAARIFATAERTIAAENEQVAVAALVEQMRKDQLAAIERTTGQIAALAGEQK